jgi:hypothetical protein
MHLVTDPTPKQPDRSVQQPAAVSGEAASAFIGTSLVLLFARGDDIERLRAEGSGFLSLVPPFHMGEEDCYLVLPDDIGEEIVDILRDGDLELLREALRDGLLVQGEVAKNPRGPGMLLDAALVCSPLDVLHPDVAHAARVSIDATRDPLRALNTLPHVQCTTLSALADDDGLEAMLRAQDDHVGVSWRPPSSAKGLADIEPTYAWSRRVSERLVGIELALFQEDDELVAVLRPALLSL